MKLRRNIKETIKNYKIFRDSTITTDKPFKPLTKYIRRSHGRNNSGKITVRHISSGTKKLYRQISFARRIKDIDGSIQTIEYDPYRSSFISLVKYEDGKHEYILTTTNMKVGDIVRASDNSVPISNGCSTMLSNIPQGCLVHNVEIKKNFGGKYARSAGTFASIVDHIGDYVIVKLSSGFTIKIHKTCYATIGQVSNIQNKNRVLYKAGQSRHLGIRPTVRGVAMNPVDHPHGGGEGKTGTKRHPVSYTCVPTKGYKTAGKRSKKNKFILSRKRK